MGVLYPFYEFFQKVIRMTSAEADFPEELTRALGDFHRGLVKAEEAMAPLLESLREELHADRTPLEQANLDLTVISAANTLFYVYLSLSGVDLSAQHPIRTEPNQECHGCRPRAGGSSRKNEAGQSSCRAIY